MLNVARRLIASLKHVVTDITNLCTLANELRTDHATQKTTTDAVVTLVSELHDDHATQKTTTDAVVTLVSELHDDHATFKTVVDDIKTLVNDIRAKLKGNYILSSAAGAAVDGDKPKCGTSEFWYCIGGKMYVKAAVAAGTAPGNDVIPQNKYGAVAFDIGADGTIDVIEAGDNATGYDSAALAKAGLAAAAADHARVLTITAMDTDEAFTFGTSDLDHAGATVAIEDGSFAFDAIGAAVATSTPATLTASKPASGPATLTASKPAAGPATLTAAAVTQTSTSEEIY
jgi:cell division septation protein DedD